jgi:hypothetical protein
MTATNTPAHTYTETQRIEAYKAVHAASLAMIDRLLVKIDAHAEISGIPTWGHIGDMTETAKKLQELLDFLG